MVNEQLQQLNSEKQDIVYTESDELQEDEIDFEEEESESQFLEAIEKFRNQLATQELEDEEDSLIMQNFLRP